MGILLAGQAADHTRSVSPIARIADAWASVALHLPELSVREIYDSAEARYLPKAFSDAGVMLLRAQSGDEYDQPYREVYADETFDWSSVAQDITVIDVKGGHSSMLQEPFVESLVTALTPKVTADKGIV